MTTVVRTIPEGYHTITQSLVVKGADKLLAFLKEACVGLDLLPTPDKLSY